MARGGTFDNNLPAIKDHSSPAQRRLEAIKSLQELGPIVATENAHKALEMALERYHLLELAMPTWVEGGFSCNGGALVLSELLEKANISHTVCVGLYWWPKKHLRQKYLEMEGVPPSKEDLKDYFYDEHHHWVKVTDPRFEHVMILDPNATIRHESYCQIQQDATRYDDRSDDLQMHLVYDPFEATVASEALGDPELQEYIRIMRLGGQGEYY